MSLVRETGSEIIAQFTVPFKGTWRPETVAIHQVPPDAIADSDNIFIHRGKLRARPGMAAYTTVENGTVNSALGGVMVTAPTEKIVLITTKSEVCLYNESGSFTRLFPNPTLAEDNSKVIDVVPVDFGGTLQAIIAEENNTLKRWIYPTNSVLPITGTNIPTAKSVCIASSRVIALVGPHSVVWSNVNNPTVFDSGAITRRAQTGDRGICVRTLSSLSFALYKERSIHTARAAGGLTESTAFTFSEPIYIEGPAGIYSVVNVDGLHIYMTASGRISMFDGTRKPIWIADGVWQYLQTDIDSNYAYLIRGVYDYRLNIVMFFYPKKGANNNENPHGYLFPHLTGIVIINLSFEGIDIPGQTAQSVFIGQTLVPITHAVDKRWSLNDIDNSAMIFPHPTTNFAVPMLLDITETLDNDLNNTDTFTCSFQTGLQPMPDARHTQVTVESFVERGQGYGSLFIEPVVSDALENASGDIPDGSGQYIDLESNPVREYKGFNRQVRFFGVRYTWQSDNHVRYSGAVVYGSTLQRYRK